MIYIARTAEGVMAIDVGWWGHERALEHALRDLDTTPVDITTVFLTHTHRDHVGAWRMVRRAEFHIVCLGEARLFG